VKRYRQPPAIFVNADRNADRTSSADAGGHELGTPP
jgi:hypothetical protein